MRFYQVVGASVVLIAVTACAESVPTSIAPARAGVAKSVGTGRATLFKNTVKYRDAGMKPATGRSGMAALTATALLGSNGVADVSVVSSIAGGAPGGTLTHVQLKLFDPNDRLQRTSNHRDLVGSSAELQLPVRVRGSKVHVQANVAGIDPNRTDVVTAIETVKLRPDLAVARVEHLPTAGLQILTQIFAVIQELNGDLGARATCVLEVDGQEVDRATGIWTDAGREVGCGFLHRFTQLGTRNIAVRVTAVDPGDFDLANNVRTSTIVITEPIPVPTDNDFAWHAWLAGASDQYGFTRGEGWWQDVSIPSRYEFTTYVERTRSGFFASSVGGDTQRSLRGPITVEFRDWVDGTMLHDDRFNEGSDTRTVFDLGLYHQDCSVLQRTVELADQYGPYTATLASLATCTSRYGEPVNQDLGTWFSYFQTSGDVTYYAESWSREVGPGYDNSYSFNGTISNAYGVLAFGTHYGFELVFTAGGDRFVASGIIPITSEDRHDVEPRQCQDYDDGTFLEHRCWESDLTFRAYSGEATGIPNR